MKPYLLTTLLFVFAFHLLKAQPATSAKLPRPPAINETTIVKDSAGNVYPYAVWSKLMYSGDAKLKSVSNKEGEFTYTLVFTSPAEKEAMLARRPKPTESEQFVPGQMFKPFKEKSIDGFKFDPKLFAGKVIALNFWFIGCPPCRAEIPDLNQIVQQYKNNADVVFIAVALDEAFEIKNYMKINPLEYHIIDNGRYIADKYKVHLYPTNVIIDRDGKILYSSQGGSASNPYWMKKMINEALASPATKIAAQ